MNIFKNLDVARFLDSFQYMWKGMLCIFVVIAVIILFIYVLNTASNKAAERKNQKEQDND